LTRRREKQRSGDIPVFEWIAAALGALLLLGAVAVLVTHGLDAASGPDLHARVDRVARVDAGWRVEVVLENRGDRTAEDVTFVAEVERGGGGREVLAELTLDQLPARSSRRGGFFLPAEPPAGLTVRATGYLEP
jgi:uncharacterized protein (TIGR02588 family)